jgi:hypothetical protein
MSRDDPFVTIYNSHCEFNLPSHDWRRILWIAQCYGWQPAGTAPPKDFATEAGSCRRRSVNWDGVYFPPDGQEIKVEDAEALATALERALPDIPNRETNERPDPAWFEDLPMPGVNCLGAFKGVRKEILSAFIGHCREDGSLWLY